MANKDFRGLDGLPRQLWAECLYEYRFAGNDKWNKAKDRWFSCPNRIIEVLTVPRDRLTVNHPKCFGRNPKYAHVSHPLPESECVRERSPRVCCHGAHKLSEPRRYQLATMSTAQAAQSADQTSPNTPHLDAHQSVHDTLVQSQPNTLTAAGVAGEPDEPRPQKEARIIFPFGSNGKSGDSEVNNVAFGSQRSIPLLPSSSEVVKRFAAVEDSEWDRVSQESICSQPSTRTRRTTDRATSSSQIAPPAAVAGLPALVTVVTATVATSNTSESSASSGDTARTISSADFQTVGLNNKNIPWPKFQKFEPRRHNPIP